MGFGRKARQLLVALLLTCSSAFATITTTDRGTGSNNASNNTIVVAPSGTMAVGSTGVLVLSVDNANAAGSNLTTTSYTDSVGNIWVERAAGTTVTTANVNVEGHILTSLLTVAFTTGDSLTINLTSNSTAETWALIEAIPTAGNQVFYWEALWTSVSATGTPSQIANQLVTGDLVIGVGAAESADTWTGDADTSGGNWSTMQHTGVGSGATGISIVTQAKVLTSVTAQTYNPTLTSCDVRVGHISFVEVDVKARALGSNGSSESATTITILDPLATGSIGVLGMMLDNAGANGNTVNMPSSIVDSKSNTWTLQQNNLFDNGAASAGVEGAFYTSVLTTPLVRGDTLTCTYTSVSVSNKLWVIWEFAPVSSGTMSYITGAVGAGATTTTPTITTGSITNADYVIALIGYEQTWAFTEDSDSSNGTWKKGATKQAASGTTGMSMLGQWKLVTGTATQTYDSTVAPSGDTLAAWVQVRETASGISAAQKASFFQFFR